MIRHTAPSFSAWHQELQRLAQEQEVSWLISDAADAHRLAYEHGNSPAEELAELADMAQWRGCGCGGG